MSKENNRLNNIIKDLNHKEDKNVLTAINQLRKHGTKEVILPIVKLLNSQPSEEVNKDILNLLFDLTDQETVDQIILLIEDDNYKNIRALLISIFWQSKLDASNHLSSFVNAAIQGDYLTAIEVMTVIDSFETTTINEDELNNLKLDLEDAIASEESNDKRAILTTIFNAIDNLSINF